MKTFCLLEVASNWDGQHRLSPLLFPHLVAPADWLQLRLSEAAQPKLTLVGGGSSLPPSTSTIALLAPGHGSEPRWWLLPRAAGLLLNGVQPLPLLELVPGDLLSFQDGSWFASTLITVEPAPAPKGLEEVPCPVCGAALKLAAVVACVCGQYFHLEHPSKPDDPAALNCYLAGACPLCGQVHSMDPHFFPDLPDKLFPAVA